MKFRVVWDAGPVRDFKPIAERLKAKLDGKIELIKPKGFWGKIRGFWNKIRGRASGCLIYSRPGYPYKYTLYSDHLIIETPNIPWREGHKTYNTMEGAWRKIIAISTMFLSVTEIDVSYRRAKRKWRKGMTMEEAYPKLPKIERIE